MRTNPLADPAPNENYPVLLLQLIHEKASEDKCAAMHVASWQQLAAYRDGQAVIDAEMECRVKNAIAHLIAEKACIYQDQSNPEGRVYHTTMYAMRSTQFFSLLLEAYRLGLSQIPPVKVTA